MQVTDVRIGVLTPKFSYDGKRIIFSSFENGCSNIYIMDTPEFKKDKIEISQNENDPKGHPERSEGSQNEEGAYRKYSKSPSRPYEFGLSFDLIYLLFSYDTASGLFGGVYTSLSDLFGGSFNRVNGGLFKRLSFWISD